MKSNIHPQYFEAAQVTCACGNQFTIGSTVPEIHVELCSKCHPFYTGEQRFVDTASRIQKYEKKREIAKEFASKRTEKAQKERKDNNPQSLRDMLMAIKNAK